MNSGLRACAAGLALAAASVILQPGWAAMEAAEGGGSTEPGAPVAQSQDDPSQPPHLSPGGADNGAARSRRGDANDDGISDSLEALLADAEPGEKFDVIVVFDRPNAVAQSRAAVGRFDVQREFSIINGYQASMTAAQIRALSSVAGLIRIEENAAVTAFDTFSNDDTGATDARPTYAVTGSGVTICILDTGINPDHEQFDSKSLRQSDFKDFTSSEKKPYDDHGHGSHVAGIAAGDGQGTSSLADDAIGVAPDAGLKIGKVLAADGSGTEAQIIDGIEWCAGMSAVSIVSMSLGGPSTDGSDAMSFAVNCAADPDYHGTCGTPAGEPKIMVISAGNSGARPETIGAPGVAEKAITVGSFAEWSGDPAVVWQNDGVYLDPFSSRGPVTDGNGNALWIKPDITGVGSRVLSVRVDDPSNPSPTAYASSSGTSMSAPFISGVIALMLEADPALGVWDANGLPHEKVRTILASTAIDRGAPGQDNEYGWGLVDAFGAVSEADGAQSYAPTEYPGYSRFAGSVADNGNWTHEFGVTSSDLGLPVAATLIIDGEFVCHSSFLGTCLAPGWDPDLELVVEEFSGGGWSQVTADTSASPEVTLSECPGSGECGGVGRVELVHFIPDVEGDYRFRVYPFADSPNNGKGGSFIIEISMGASGSGTSGDTTPPTPDPMTWATAPTATGQNSIDMTASTATDDSGGIEYQFECTLASLGDCGSSAWQTATYFEQTGLDADTTYSFRVRARDAHGNATAWSTAESATTLAPEPDMTLVLDTVETGKYGNNFDGAIDEDGEVHAAFTIDGTPEDLVLSFDGYDIDHDAELRLLVNGADFGTMPAGVNDGLAPYSVIIGAEDLQTGENRIIFKQDDNVIYKWGVTNVLLELAPASDQNMTLVLGELETGKYGNKFDGVMDEDGLVDASFTLDDTSQDLLLTFDGYDIDHDAELRLLVNGADLGTVPAGVNDGLAPYSVVVPAGSLSTGDNVITFKQDDNVIYKWGVTNVLLEQAPAPETDMTLVFGTLETGKYGNKFDGVTDDDGIVQALFNFESAPQSLLLTFDGYDIDHDAELRLLVNGADLGTVPAGVNDGLAPYSVTIPPGSLSTGDNIITFKQDDNVIYKWGVTNILLDVVPMPEPDMTLVLGTLETGKYGNKFDGATDEDGEVQAAFTLDGAPESLVLNFDGYDIDHDFELRLLVNGIDLGTIPAGVNNGLAPYSVSLAAHVLQTGDNFVTFRQDDNVNYKWGVTDILLEQASAS